MGYLEERNRLFSGINEELIKPFLFARGYFTEIDVLPGYINPSSFDDVTLDPLDWSNPPPRTSSIDILVEKPDKGLRKFSLLHPFMYIHLANEVLNNLELIKTRLLRETAVNVYSIPPMMGFEEMAEPWKYFSRVDPAQHFLSHTTIATTDIYNFYGSIYTHSIAWALHGRDEAKNRVRDLSLPGNRLDKLFQNAQDGQTNGIPAGNVISDLMAELVLKDIDELISPLANELDIKVFRYRDDYRFVCKNKKDARMALDQLALSLNTHYGLTLNQSKTRIYDVETYSEKLLKGPDADIDLPIELSAQTVRLSGVELYEYLQRIKKTGHKHAFDSGIKKLTDSLRSASSPIVVASNLDEWMDLIFVSLIDAINMGRSTDGYIYLLIDFLIGEAQDVNKRQRLFDNLIGHTGAGANVARKLWTFAILLNHDSERARQYADDQTSPLFKIASDPSIRQISVFETRDSLPSGELEKLDDFILINFDLFGRINGREDIFTIMEDELYEGMSSAHYDV